MTPERAKVLIVDDSLVIRKVLRALMQRVGLTDIDEACDGADALDLLGMRAYDLVLAEWTMPHVNGLELLKTIRHHHLHPQPLVVLFCADVTSRRRGEAIDCGASAIVPKPFVATDLCEEIARLLAAHPADQARSTAANEAQVPL